MPDKETRSRGASIGVAAAVVAALIALLGFFGFTSIRDLLARDDSPSTVGSDQISLGPEATESGAPSEPTDEEGKDPSREDRFVQELTIEDTVDDEECHQPGYTGSSWESKAVSVGRDDFSRTITCFLYGNPTEGYMDFLVPEQATFLKVTVGQNDDSPDPMRLEFSFSDVTGNPLHESVIAEYGNSYPVTVSVSDAKRVRLGLRVLSGESDDDGDAVWANLMFTNRP